VYGCDVFVRLLKLMMNKTTEHKQQQHSEIDLRCQTHEYKQERFDYGCGGVRTELGCVDGDWGEAGSRIRPAGLHQGQFESIAVEDVGVDAWHVGHVTKSDSMRVRLHDGHVTKPVEKGADGCDWFVAGTREVRR
jgi:hypothetical protein